MSNNTPVKVKKVASLACNACKKRKVKCIGNPCAYCIKKNYVCEFNTGKKRGPPKKVRYPKGVEECGSMSVVLLNHIQSSMDETYRQNNFVDFYFQYIGRAIPNTIKNALKASSEQDLNSDLITQLYIVSAHVMQFFGNSELEMQCIDKAQRYASNIFNCDTVESATALMMMALYLGPRNPKFKTYLNLAFDITKLSALKNSIDALKMKYACEALLTFSDPNLTTKQKYQSVVEKIFSKAELETSKLTPHLSSFEKVPAISIKLKYMLMELGDYDDSSLHAFIKMVNSPAKILTAEQRTTLMIELEKLDNVVKEMDSDNSKYVYSVFMAHHSRFLIEWRSGNIQEAIKSAVDAVNFYKQNKNLLGLWNHSGFIGSLNLPYFLQVNGMPEKAQEILDSFEQSCISHAPKEELRAGWKELCIATGIYSTAQEWGSHSQATAMESSPTDGASPSSSSPALSPPSPSLSPPQSPETLCISQSILQSFEHSISQHVAHPMSQIISPMPMYYTEPNTNQQILPQQQQQQQQQQLQIPQQLPPQQLPPQQFLSQPHMQTFSPQQNNNMQTVYNFGVNADNSINNTTNNNYNNNNTINSDPSILLFDHDTLSDLLFSPIMPVLNDIMYQYPM